MEKVDIEVNPQKPIKESWGADAGLSSAFANALRNNPDLFGQGNYLDSMEYRFFAKEVFLMDQDATRGVEATLRLKGGEDIKLQDYCNLLVNSIVDGDSEEMRLLLYTEKDLRDKLGIKQGEVSNLVEETINNLEYPEKSKKVLKDTIRGLRIHIIHTLPFEGKKINVRFEVEKKLNFSTNEYIVFPEAGKVSQIGDVDIVEVPNTIVFCTPSDESVDLKESGQDAAAIVGLENGFLLIEADGVSQSYRSELAARFSVREIAKSGTLNLEENLNMVSQEIQKYHNEMPELDTTELWEVVVNVLNERKEKAGSQTTFNQMFIEEKTGEVKGLFCGDGGFAILRKGKNLERYSLQGEFRHGPDAVLSTKFGAVGNLRRMEDLVEQKIFLNPGDIVFLYSDGVTNSVLDKCVEVVHTESKDLQKTKIAEILDDQAQDDRTLLIYKHQ